MELHRKVILLLRSTHHKRCRHYAVDLLLGMLHDAFDEIFKLPSPVRNFRSSVMAFVEALSGNRPGDAPDVADPDNFRDAINSLREISKRRDPQLRYLYDEIQTLRAEIATHERIITCLEYRHVLESLPQKSSLKNNGLLAKTKDATTIWKHTWKLAVEKQLTAMLEAKIDERIVASGNAAPQRTATHSDLHLETLLRFDFEYWVRTNPKI